MYLLISLSHKMFCNTTGNRMRKKFINVNICWVEWEWLLGFFFPCKNHSPPFFLPIIPWKSSNAFQQIRRKKPQEYLSYLIVVLKWNRNQALYNSLTYHTSNILIMAPKFVIFIYNCLPIYYEVRSIVKIHCKWKT